MKQNFTTKRYLYAIYTYACIINVYIPSIANKKNYRTEYNFQWNLNSPEITYRLDLVVLP